MAATTVTAAPVKDSNITRNSPTFMAFPYLGCSSGEQQVRRAWLIPHPNGYHTQQDAARGAGFEAHLPRPWRRHFHVHGLSDADGLTGRRRHLTTGRELGAVLRDHAPHPYDGGAAQFHPHPTAGERYVYHPDALSNAVALLHRLRRDA